MDHTEVSDWIIFIGRFHPLVVHLPIGIILAGVAMHFLARKKKFSQLKGAVPFLMGAGAVGAILSCVFGYMLSFQGGYDTDALNSHQWMGVVLAVFAVVAFFSVVWKKTKRIVVLQSGLMAFLLLGLGYTGHLGGNLTHGASYLTHYSPDPLRKLVGLPPKPEKRPPVMVLDSADIFLDVVSPMLSDYCVSCHNPGKSKGDLVLSSYEHILRGGENGLGVVAGDLGKSELFRRVALPEHHDDFMPPDGKKPLSEEQKKLLELWIMNGAPDKGQMGHFEIEGDYLLAANKVLGLEDHGSNSLARKVEPADSLLVASLSANGYVIKTLSGESNLLDVSFLPNRNKEGIQVDELLPLKDQIVYLNLGNLNLRDQDLEIIGQFENMVRLNIHSNPITNEGLAFSKLQNLEALNLYGTQIGDNGLEGLELLQKLRRIYLWNTLVTQEKVDNLKAKRPDLEINLGEVTS
jgi:uncharacterized membrane protein